MLVVFIYIHLFVYLHSFIYLYFHVHGLHYMFTLCLILFLHFFFFFSWKDAEERPTYLDLINNPSILKFIDDFEIVVPDGLRTLIKVPQVTCSGFYFYLLKYFVFVFLYLLICMLETFFYLFVKTLKC
jgi:hypothetical protein